MVLIAAGNSLALDRIREALCLQFPDFRPSAAVVHGNSFGGNSGNFNNQNRSQSNHSKNQQGKGSRSSSSRSASSHGKGRSNFTAPRKVFQAEQGQDLDPIDENQADADEDNDQDEFQDAQDQQFDDENQQTEQGDDLDDQLSGLSPEELQDLASVLTVTSKKLQSTVLGRKYSGKPKTIEERKKNSTCSACGEQGHWHGDSICPMSGTGSKGRPWWQRFQRQEL